MSSATMSSVSPLFNSKGKTIEELYDIDIDIDISNQPFDYSSPVKDYERPEFMTPEPVSPKKFKGFVFGSNKNAFPPKPVLKRQNKVSSILGKRKFGDSFEDSDDERYGQHIGDKFFKVNVGHAVRPASPTPDNWEDQSWNEYVQKEGKRERDSESKYDPEEIIQWCFKYLAEKQNQK